MYQIHAHFAEIVYRLSAETVSMYVMPHNLFSIRVALPLLVESLNT